ncbi:MAG TPA: hypothetical protein VK791_08060 [bacterium]|jgi:hypothetical protein|nr:hypothetical protein [bacterium]
MKKKNINPFKAKYIQWLSEPLGNLGVVLDSADTELNPPKKVVTEPRSKTKVTRGRGDKREVPRHVEEFHPRGAAGRREVRSPQHPHKAVMPHKGNRPKYPK